MTQTSSFLSPAGEMVMSTVAPPSRCCSRPQIVVPSRRLRRASASPWPADPSDLVGILGQGMCCGQPPEHQPGQLLSAAAVVTLCARSRGQRTGHPYSISPHARRLKPGGQRIAAGAALGGGGPSGAGGRPPAGGGPPGGGG